MLPQPLISKTLKNKTWVGLRSIYKLILISPFHNSIEKQSQWLHPHRNLTYGVRGQIKQFCSGELFKFTSKSVECWTSYSKMCQCNLPLDNILPPGWHPHISSNFTSSSLSFIQKLSCTSTWLRAWIVWYGKYVERFHIPKYLKHNIIHWLIMQRLYKDFHTCTMWVLHLLSMCIILWQIQTFLNNF